MDKRQAVLLIILASAAILLLSAGLPDMQLMPGLPFPSGELHLNKPVAVQNDNGSLFLPLMKFPKIIIVLFVVSMVLFSIGLFIYFFSKDFKKLLACLIGVSVLMVGITLLAPQSPPTGYGQNGVMDYSPPVFRTSPLGEAPLLLVWLVVGSLVLVTGALAMLLLRKILHNDRTKERFLQEAEDALAAIRSGEDLNNVIMRCYLQMGAALQAEQGIRREDNVTTREFEALLESKGVAHDPVHRLTRLFEAARYGHKPAASPDEQTAIDCLNQILQTFHKAA